MLKMWIILNSNIKVLLLMAVRLHICVGFDGIRNLALGKGATDNKVNDGNYGSFHGVRTNQSIRVNLYDNIYIRKVHVYLRSQYGSGNITLLTSKYNAASSPSLLNTQWDIVYYIRGSVQGNFTIPLYLKQPVQHLALLSHTTALHVAEIEIYDYDEENGPVNQLQRSKIENVTSSRWLSSAYHAVDGNSNMFDVESFFQSTGYDFAWWQVNLNYSYSAKSAAMNLKIYPFLNRKFAYESDFSYLSSFEVVLWNRQSVPPYLLTSSGATGSYRDSLHWLPCLPYITVNDSSLHAEDVNGPIIYKCDATADNFKYLAIIKTRREQLVLAEVEGHQPEPGSPTRFNLNPVRTNPNLVTLSWTSSALHYRWRCNSSQVNGTWSAKTTSKSVTSSRHSANSLVTCYVIAVDDGGISDAVSAAATTSCAKPGVVKAIAHDGEIKTSNNKLKVNITWMRPSLNCSLTFQYELGNGSKTSTQSTATQLFDLNPHTNYSLHIRVKNKDVTSDVVTYNFTTKQIVPYYNERENFKLNVTSSECVRAVWSEPTYSNGVLNEYKVICRTQNRNVTSTVAAPSTQTEVCGFRPHTNVYCDLTASNGAGFGNSYQMGPVMTECAAPEPVQYEIIETLNGNQRNLKPNLTEEVIPNCNYIDYFILATPVISYDRYEMTPFTIDAELENFEVTIYAVNNEGLQSKPSKLIVNEKGMLVVIIAAVGGSGFLIIIIIIIIVLCRTGKINSPAECCASNPSNNVTNETANQTSNNVTNETANQTSNNPTNKTKKKPTKTKEKPPKEEKNHEQPTKIKPGKKPKFKSSANSDKKKKKDEKNIKQKESDRKPPNTTSREMVDLPLKNKFQKDPKLAHLERETCGYSILSTDDSYEDIDELPGCTYENTEHTHPQPRHPARSPFQNPRQPPKPPSKSAKPTLAMEAYEPESAYTPMSSPIEQVSTSGLQGELANAFKKRNKQQKHVVSETQAPVNPAVGYVNQAQQFVEKFGPIYDLPPSED